MSLIDLEQHAHKSLTQQEATRLVGLITEEKVMPL